MPSMIKYMAITIPIIESACQKPKKKFNAIPKRTAIDKKRQARVSFESAIKLLLPSDLPVLYLK